MTKPKNARPRELNGQFGLFRSVSLGFSPVYMDHCIPGLTCNGLGQSRLVPETLPLSTTSFSFGSSLRQPSLSSIGSRDSLAIEWSQAATPREPLIADKDLLTKRPA
jgi:hypothetical protein